MSKETILLIDDEKTVTDSLLNQLRTAFPMKYRYETAANTEEAMEIIDECYEDGETIELIISDWLMPKVKGHRFLMEVTKKYPDIKQIMLSGFADDESVELAKEEANLKAFIKKPWEEEELIETVKKVLGE